jgi:DNA-binding response OmpR family regulator
MTGLSERPRHLLVIDDDVRLLEAMGHYFRHAGYEVTTAPDGPSGLACAADQSPDIVVLDIMMSGMDGWEVCRRMREVSHVPIIMLTARGGESDRVMGLRLGADDYVPKPFSLKELEARIEAVLRRVYMAPPPEDNVVYDDGHLRLELNGLRVYRDGDPVALTLTERRMLFRLASEPGRAIPLQHLLRDIWGPEYEQQTDYVKLYIWRLRQKLERSPGRPTYVRTERGIGYRFDAQPAQSGAPAQSERKP